MPATTYLVNGMTCDHCARAVTQELSGLPGVTDVQVHLTPGGTSTVLVASQQPLEAQTVRKALDEAGGYTVA